MKIKYALRALREIDQTARWWYEHRPDARSLFEQELAAAIRQIRTAPRLGKVYRVVRGREQRRVLMPKTAQHVYYRVAGPELILILSVWDARRRHGPRLR